MAPNLILFYSFSFCNFQKNFHFIDWVIQHYITWNRKEIRNALERGLKNNFHSMLICVPFCYSHFNGIKHFIESPIYLSANLNLSINNIHFGTFISKEMGMFLLENRWKRIIARGFLRRLSGPGERKSSSSRVWKKYRKKYFIHLFIRENNT